MKKIQISIHAPANGATEMSVFHSRESIFQSTLRRTERRYQHPLTYLDLYFNPRSGERSDLTDEQIEKVMAISIHAPANGATVLFLLICLICIFQSTLRRTERRQTHSTTVMMILFQSTLRRTERQTDI